MASTRNAGRQSSSQHATSRLGRRVATRRAVMSSRPRTALTGVPSGARTESGTPKKARKYSEAVSSRRSGRRAAGMVANLRETPVQREPLTGEGAALRAITHGATQTRRVGAERRAEDPMNATTEHGRPPLVGLAHAVEEAAALDAAVAALRPGARALV